MKKYNSDYITISLTSEWLMKEFPEKRCREFIFYMPEKSSIMAFNSKSGFETSDNITLENNNSNYKNLGGKHSLLQSASLQLNLVKNTPDCAIFCSNILKIGFSSLSNMNIIVEIKENSACKPCRIHANNAYIQEYFNCADMIEISEFRNCLLLNIFLVNLN